MDWKWLFIYPELGVASVNELALPLDTPVTMDITSASVMNAIFHPGLAGQIYAMAGMCTQMFPSSPARKASTAGCRRSSAAMDSRTCISR